MPHLLLRLLPATLALCAGLGGAPALAAIRYAKPAASGTGTCGSWANACRLEAALTAATSGDEVWVAAGVHKPTTVTTSRNATFKLVSGVTVYGGFAGTETARAERDFTTRVTVLSGDIDNNDSQTPVVTNPGTVTGNTHNSNHVVTCDATDAALDGFTITGGYADDAVSNREGGGVLVRGAVACTLRNLLFSGNYAVTGGGGLSYAGGVTLTLDSVVFRRNVAPSFGGGIGSNDPSAANTLTLANSTFEANASAWAGGGLYIRSPATVSHVTFESNTSLRGGGASVWNGTATFRDVVFRSNAATEAGGAFSSQYAALVFERVHFVGNRAEESGGGLLSLQDTALEFNSVVFSGNSCAGGGGAMNVDTSTPKTVTLTNTTISGNWSGFRMGGVLIGVPPRIRNSILWGNSPGNLGHTNDPSRAPSGTSLSYSIVEGGCPAGATITCDHVSGADPLFLTPVTPGATPSTTGNLRVQPSSPAIDAGDNDVTSPALLALDIDSAGRRQDAPLVADTGNGTVPLVDLGAYEANGIAADLIVTKSNDAGAARPGVPFSWRLAVRNAGSFAAGFPAGRVLLRDEAPDLGVTYGAVTVENKVGVSGNLTCGLDGAAVLTCTAPTGVTLSANAAFDVVLPATISVSGAYPNPRIGGVCAVDPDHVVPEAGETNNGCSNSVTAKLTPTLVTEVHDANHQPVAGPVPPGDLVHGKGTVSGSAGVPTGTLTLNIHDRPGCGAVPRVTATVPLTAGSAESPAIPMPAPGFYFQAVYNGDDVYYGVLGPCMLLLAEAILVNTLLDDAGDGMCSDSHCTLREAMALANTLPEDNRIRFGVHGTITLTAALPEVVGAGSLSITNDTGFPVIIDGAGQFQAFTVASNAVATLERLSVRDAKGDTDPGGAVFNRGTLSVEGCAFIGNSARRGGAVGNSGTLTMTNCTLAANQATGTGPAAGGGAFSQAAGNGVATLRHCTLVGNSAALDERSGLYLGAGRLTLQSSILAGNGAAGQANLFLDPDATFTSAGHNLTNSAVLAGATPTDLLATEPVLGGAVESGHRPPLATSPAIDRGDAAACPGVDGRGARREDLGCDIGAFEALLADLDNVTVGLAAGTPQTLGPTFAVVDTEAAGTCTAVNVKRVPTDHPNGVADPATRTGNYWQLTLSPEGCSGARVGLSLPVFGRVALSHDKACRWDLGASRWDCGFTSEHAVGSAPRLDGSAQSLVLRSGVVPRDSWTLGEGVFDPPVLSGEEPAELT
ncbi:MAG: hypothetical protein HY901_04570, partial [Deltaproteobacteria bacterium]|nr:hypothetical protein [Deltaproteobacteria bacterium]